MGATFWVLVLGVVVVGASWLAWRKRSGSDGDGGDGADHDGDGADGGNGD